MIETHIADGSLLVADNKTKMFLIELQNEQDGGKSWGEAFLEAIETVRDLP